MWKFWQKLCKMSTYVIAFKGWFSPLSGGCRPSTPLFYFSMFFTACGANYFIKLIILFAFVMLYLCGSSDFRNNLVTIYLSENTRYTRIYTIGIFLSFLNMLSISRIFWVYPVYLRIFRISSISRMSLTAASFRKMKFFTRRISIKQNASV